MKTKNIIQVWFLLAYVIIFETTTKIYQFRVENELRIKFQKNQIVHVELQTIKKH